MTEYTKDVNVQTNVEAHDSSQLLTTITTMVKELMPEVRDNSEEISKMYEANIKQLVSAELEKAVAKRITSFVKQSEADNEMIAKLTQTITDKTLEVATAKVEKETAELKAKTAEQKVKDYDKEKSEREQKLAAELEQTKSLVTLTQAELDTALDQLESERIHSKDLTEIRDNQIIQIQELKDKQSNAYSEMKKDLDSQYETKIKSLESEIDVLDTDYRNTISAIRNFVDKFDG